VNAFSVLTPKENKKQKILPKEHKLVSRLRIKSISNILEIDISTGRKIMEF